MAVDLRASKTGYLTLDQAAAINASDATLAKFVAGLPKAELHLHIEGTVEPRLMLTIARRNGIAIEGADDAERFCAAQRAMTLNSDDPAYFFGHTDKYGTTHGGPPCRNQNISLRAFDAPGRWRGGVV